jgi:hypothetical protein
MKMTVVLALSIAAAALTPIAAQDKPLPQAPVVQPSTPGSTRNAPLKVQLTLSRFMGEKKISSAPYMFGVLPGGAKTSLRMGVQVPVTTTVFGGKPDAANIPQSSYTYKDVGTNIDCQAQDMGNGVYNLVITVSDSSINLDRQAQTGDDKRIARDIPSFRSFHASFAMALRDGQTMQYASATDPVSGEVMKIDVMLALAK